MFFDNNYCKILNIRIIYLSLLIALSLTSCKELSFPSFFNKGTKLAKIGSNELYIDDVKGVFYAGITPQDSVDLLNAYVDKWVKTMLKIEKAEEQFTQDNDDIEELIKQYRNSLLLNKYDNFHTASIDTAITNDEIAEYYKINKELFHLPNPIVTGKILIYPKSYRAEKKLLELFKSKKPSDIADLSDLSVKHNLKSIDFKEWTYFTELLKHIPFSEQQFDDFLRNNSFYEISDDNNKYVMQIESYRNSGDYTPIVMVRNVIQKMIINGRRTQKLKEVEDSLYQKAVIDGDVVITELDNK